MNERVGVLTGCSLLCHHCFCKSDLTVEEMAIVWDGPPRWGYVERYPRYATDTEGWERYVRDEEGEILFDENVHFDPQTMWPRDQDGSEITVLYDDGTWEDGVSCEVCGEYLIEPYTVSCHACSTLLAFGREAHQLEVERTREQIVCEPCMQQRHLQARNELVQHLEKRARVDRTVALFYRQHAQRLREHRTVLAYRQALLQQVQAATQAGWSAPLAISPMQVLQMIDLIDERIEDWEEDLTIEPIAQPWREEGSVQKVLPAEAQQPALLEVLLPLNREQQAPPRPGRLILPVMLSQHFQHLFAQSRSRRLKCHVNLLDGKTLFEKS
jgi:hypothetical protein